MREYRTYKDGINAKPPIGKLTAIRQTGREKFAELMNGRKYEDVKIQTRINLRTIK